MSKCPKLVVLWPLATVTEQSRQRVPWTVSYALFLTASIFSVLQIPSTRSGMSSCDWETGMIANFPYFGHHIEFCQLKLRIRLLLLRLLAQLGDRKNLISKPVVQPHIYRYVGAICIALAFYQGHLKPPRVILRYHPISI